MALNKLELKDIEKIQNVFYMKPPLSMLDKFIKDNKGPYEQTLKKNAEAELTKQYYR